MKNVREEKKGRKKTNEEIQKDRQMWAEAKRRQRAKETPEIRKEKKISGLINQINKLNRDDFEEVMRKTLTPKKRKIVHALGLSYKEMPSAESRAVELKSAMKGEKKWKKALLKNLAKKKNSARFRIALGVCWRTWYRMTKEDKSAIPSAQYLRCIKFYRDVSIPVPGTRQAGKSVLPDTIRHLHRTYQQDNPSISLSKFAALRPADVLTVDKTRLVGCVCEYCVNLSYKVFSFHAPKNHSLLVQ